MVIDRSAFLSGDYLTVFEEIVEVKEATGEAHLKVILETGELETYDNVRRASVLAMAAGADFIKTSTGKVQPASTLPVTRRSCSAATRSLSTAVTAPADPASSTSASASARPATWKSPFLRAPSRSCSGR